MNSEFLEDFKTAFETVKNKGWISVGSINLRKNDDGNIGRFFEDEMKIAENNLQVPDFGDIEIKTQRRSTGSLLTLFSKAPDYPKNANTYLKNNYGYFVEEFNGNRLNQTIRATEFIKTDKYDYSFKLKVDISQEKVFFIIKNKNGDIVDQSVFYTFSSLKQILNSKIKKIAYVKVDSKKENEETFIRFNEVQFLYEPDFMNFINMLNFGEILIDIRIGYYHNPNSELYGKVHDHGTAFRIPQNKFENLFKIMHL